MPDILQKKKKPKNISLQRTMRPVDSRVRAITSAAYHLVLSESLTNRETINKAGL